MIFRPPTLDDAEGVAALIAARDADDFGQSHPAHGEELRAWWAQDAGRLAADAWIAVDGGRIVGFARMGTSGRLAEVEDESCVHPDFRGRSIGTRLVELAEGWARERGRPGIHVAVVNEPGRRLLEGRGYRPVRQFWRMEIELHEEPPEPSVPDGFELRGYRPGTDDRPLHELHQRAFAGDWGFVPVPLDGWLAWRIPRPDFDSELWVVGTHGGELAGLALAFGSGGLGWVLDLAVGERFRGRGLGQALLEEAFRRLFRKGHPQAGLEVDAENETGAPRLYERAGMRVTRRYETYELPLAPAA